MGDQIGESVSGTLFYVPYEEFTRIRSLSVDAVEIAKLFSAFCRINTLYLIARAGSGHIGSSFSSLDIMSWLQLNELRTPEDGDCVGPRDIFFSSKGHDAPGLYSTWIGLGKLKFELIHQLRRLNGLPGHPDVSIPNVITNTGSLGMGVSKAKGMVVANRLQKKSGNIFVLTGDGELQEGQFWESLISAANSKLHELTVIIDHNKMQSDMLVSTVSDLGDLEGKLSAFGWHVSRCDGNDIRAFSETLAATKNISDKPKIIIADTIKGKGVSFMEHTSIDSDVEFYKFHSGAPTADAYVNASQELINAANAQLRAVNADELLLETVSRPNVAPRTDYPQRLIQAYSKCLVEQARDNAKIVALDADLILDTGLIPFQSEFPDRFVECGIAEQDMVSQAGGMASLGLLPIVHSFACFLSTRPNEQIYNNSTERNKIIYVGSLAGLVPAGPGHSHQAVRDISSLGAIPELVMMEPSCESEVCMLLHWAVNSNHGSSYLRLVSVPWEISYELPEDYCVPELGKGVRLREGADAILIAYGPIMLTLACDVAELLESSHGIHIKVLNLPWLNYVDKNWICSEIGNCKNVYALDNHFSIGGQGDRISSIIASSGQSGMLFTCIGVENVPVSGENHECLNWHNFSKKKLAERIVASHSF